MDENIMHFYKDLHLNSNNIFQLESIELAKKICQIIVADGASGMPKNLSYSNTLIIYSSLVRPDDEA